MQVQLLLRFARLTTRNGRLKLTTQSLIRITAMSIVAKVSGVQSLTHTRLKREIKVIIVTNQEIPTRSGILIRIRTCMIAGLTKKTHIKVATVRSPTIRTTRTGAILIKSRIPVKHTAISLTVGRMKGIPIKAGTMVRQLASKTIESKSHRHQSRMQLKRNLVKCWLTKLRDRLIRDSTSQKLMSPLEMTMQLIQSLMSLRSNLTLILCSVKIQLTKVI